MPKRRSFRFNNATRYNIYKAQRGLCYLCGKPLPPYTRKGKGHASRSDIVHLDHVVPGSEGGGNGVRNCAMAHRECDGEKGQRMPYACELLFVVVIADILRESGGDRNRQKFPMREAIEATFKVRRSLS